MTLLSGAYKLSGTNTFRLSCSKILGHWGSNCQNPDNRLMEGVIPRLGNIFLQCDQAGAEALIMAYLARPGRMRSLFQNGIKPHTYLAMHIFADKFIATTREQFWMASATDLKANRAWADLNKLISEESPDEYALGKMTCHAKNYDMKARTFQMNVLERSGGTIVLSFQQASEFLAMFDTLFPEIIELQEEIKGIVRSTRVLRNLFGHPKRFIRPLNSSYERQWLSYIAQSTVGELTVIASNEIRQYLHKHKLNNEILLVNNKHDSLLLDCPIRHRDLGIHLLRSTMAKELTTPRGEVFRMGVEVSEGTSWDKKGMKKIK